MSATKRLEDLKRRKNQCELELLKAVNDLLAFEVLLRKKPIIWHDWPGHQQRGLRRVLAMEEGQPSGLPRHD